MLRKAAAALIVLLYLSGVADGAFDYFSSETRPMGMGDSFTAVADDPSAIYFNPAGLAQINRLSLNTQFSRLVGGLESGESVDMASFGLAVPGWGAFSFQSYRADDLAREQIASASVAREIRKFLSFPFYAGLTVKGMRREYPESSFFTNAVNNGGAVTSTPDPLFQGGRSVTVMGIDAGLLVRFGPERRWAAGAAALNLNKPDAALGSVPDRVPSTGRAGLAYYYRKGILSADLRKTTRASQSDTDGSVGFEHRIDFVSVRGGYARGSRDGEAWSAGLSVLMGWVRLDYGFLFRTGHLSETSGGHRFGLVTAFGRSGGESIGPFESAVRRIEKGLSAHADRVWFQSVVHKKRSEFHSFQTDIYSDWDGAVRDFLDTVDPPERGFAEAAIRYWAEGNEAYALHFLRRLSGPVQQSSRVAALHQLVVLEMIYDGKDDDVQTAGGQL